MTIVSSYLRNAGPLNSTVTLSAHATLNNVGAIYGLVTGYAYSQSYNTGRLTQGVDLIGAALTNARSGVIVGAAFGVEVSGSGVVPATIVNDGSITATTIGVALYGGGVLTNAADGYIHGGSYGVLVATNAATISNAGLISGVTAVVDRASGTVLTNAATGTIASSYNGVYASAAIAIDNAGTIISGANRSGVRLVGGGSLTNEATGTIHGGYYGVRIDSVGATLTNDGRIDGSTGLDASVGGVTLINAGTIVSHGGATVFLNGSNNRVVLDAGEVMAGALGGYGSNDVLELAAGSAAAGTLAGLGSAFSGFSDVTVDAGAYWALAGSDTLTSGTTLTNGGTLSNAGTLHGALTLAAGSVLSNAPSGYIGSGSYGLLITTAGASITNAGTIYGFTGVAATVAGVTLTNAGTISSSGGQTMVLTGRNNRLILTPSAVQAGAYGGNAGYGANNVLELGTGTGTGVLTGWGTSFRGFNVIAVDAGANWILAGPAVISDASTLNNAGTLLGPIDMSGISYLTNANNGVISGGAYGVVANSVAMISNAGTIAGTTDGLNLTGFGTARIVNKAGGYIHGGSYAVRAPAARLTLINAGTIRGQFGVVNRSGIASVVNSGTIQGTGGASVYLGGSYNQLTLDAGEVLGDAFGGGGRDDVLELAAGSSASATLVGWGTSFTGFGTLAIDAGANWALAGSNAVQSNVTLQNAGTLTGSLTLQTGAVVSNAATGIIDAVYGGNGLNSSGVATIVNSGVINAYPRHTGVLLNGGGSLTNAATGTINGGYYGLRLYNSGATILNAGTITGTTGVQAFVGGVTLIDSGSIRPHNGAAVLLSGANNRLVLDPGEAIAGNIIGGGGTNDVLELAAGSGALGTLTGLGSTALYGFDTVIVDAGANWLLSGANTIAADVTFTDAGLLSNAGTLLGSVSLASGGVLFNEAGATINDAAGIIGTSGGVQLANAGTILATGGAAVTFIGTGNRLFLEPGEVIAGSINGGGDTNDVLELAPGSRAFGTLTGLGSTYLYGFSTVSVDVSANWLLSGANTIAAGVTFTDAGLLSNAGTLVGAVSLASGSVLVNQAGAIINDPAGITGTADGVVLTNAGTILANGTAAVTFSGTGNRLILDAGEVLTGAIGGNGTNVLELAAGTAAIGTITGLGSAFTGFSDVTVDAGASWQLSGANAIYAGTTLTNAGTLTGALSLNDGAQLSNAAGGTISGSSYGVSGTGAATIVNASTITSTIDGIDLTGGGSVTNAAYGAIYGGVYGIRVDGTTAATITNLGTIEGQRGVGEQVAGVTLTNAGTIIGTSGPGVYLTGSANRLILDAGEVLTDASGGLGTNNVLELAAGTAASGTLTGLGSAFTGFGTIVVDPNATWVLTGANTVATGVTLINAGTLADQDAGAAGVVLAAGAILTNAAAGRITSYFGNFGVDVSGTATIDSAGYIGSQTDGVRLNGGGSLNNSGYIHGQRYGVQIATVAAAFTNSGLVVGGNAGVYAVIAGVTIVNAGSIIGSGGETDVTFHGANNRLVLDPGQIIEYRTGHDIAAGGAYGGGGGNDVLELAAGTVAIGTLTGLGSLFFGFDTLQVDAGANWVIYGANTLGAALTLTGAGTLTNDGSAAGQARLSGGITLINSSAGTLTDANYAVYGVGTATIINAGSITSGGDGVNLVGGGSISNAVGGYIQGDVYGVRIGLTAATVINDGVIRGRLGVLAHVSGVTLTNAGTIVGTLGADVSLTGSDNRLILDAGEVLASASGGFGTNDVVELAAGTAARGTLSGFGTALAGFSTIAVDAGANWVLAASNVYAPSLVLTDSGTLTIAATASIASAGYGLTATGGATIVNAGEIAGIEALAGGVTLTNNGTVLAHGGTSVRLTGANNRLVLGAHEVITGSVTGGNGVNDVLELAPGSSGTLSSLMGFSGIVVDAGAAWSLPAGYTLASGTTLTNAGTVTGAVRLASGARLVLDAGEVLAGATGSGGTVLELAAGTAAHATLTGLGTSFQGFNTIDVDAGANWSLSGSTVLGSGTTLNNAGTLQSALSLSTGAQLSNAARGTISSATYGIFGTGAATVVNAGSITSTKDGINLTGGGSVTNAVGGSIYGGSYGVRVVGATAATITNFGVIGGQLGVVERVAGVTLTNAGTIYTTGGPGVFLTGANNRLILDAGEVLAGSASGGGGANDVVELAAGTAAVGTLAGWGSTITGFNRLQVDAGANWSLTGSLSLTAGYTLSDAGTLSGTVTMASGDRLILGAGAVIGRVAAAGSNDVLELAAGTAAVGTLTGLGSALTGFTSIVVDAGADWSLPGGFTVASGNTSAIAGTLSGAISVAPGGRLVLNAGAVIAGPTIAANSVLELGSGSGSLAGLAGWAGTIAVDAGGTWVLSGTNSTDPGATLNGPGTLNNAGTLSNGLTLAAGAAFTNSGTVDGVITVDAGARLLLEAGEVLTGATGSGNAVLELAAGGGAVGTLAGIGTVFTGFNTIAIDAGALWSLGTGYTIGSGITVSNAGTLDSGVLLAAGAAFTNAASAVVQGAAYGVQAAGAAMIVNAGTIEGTIGVQGLTGGVTLTNTGSILGSGGTAVSLAGANNRLILGAGAVLTSAYGGNASNDVLELAAGTASSGTLTGLGDVFIGFGSIVVDAGAAWVLGASGDFGGTLTDAGVLTNAGTVGAGITLVGNGRLTNTAGGAIYGTGYGVTATAAGTIVNAGVIAGIEATAAGVTVSDTGTILAQGGTSVLLTGAGNRLILGPGAVVSGAVGGNRVNDVLELTGSGGTLTGSGSFTGFSGIVVDAGADWSLPGGYTLASGVTLTNAGTLATPFAVAAGASLVLDPGAVTAGATVASGNATLELAAGTAASGTLSGFDSTLVGFSTIATDAGANWVLASSNVYAPNVVLTGAGTLTIAASTSIAGPGYGVTATGGAMIVNAGVIAGIEGLAGGVTLTNDGTILTHGGASVRLTGANNRLVLGAHAVITGSVTGGNGVNDVLELGPGSSGTLSSLMGFSSIVVDAGASWSLPAGYTLASGLTLTNAGTLKTPVTLASGARLVLDPGEVDAGATGAGNSVLELGVGNGSVGTLSGLGTSLTGFGAITIDAGASWSLTAGYTLASGTTLTNAGTLKTPVTLAGGARLVLDPGERDAGATGAGNNVLELGAGNGNVGTLSGLGTTLTGFGAIAIDASAGWALTGPVTQATNLGTISSGVTVASGGTLTNAATASISSSNYLYALVALTGATIVNAGRITRSDGVVELQQGSYLTNSAGGYIGGNPFFYAVNSTGSGVRITNAGMIAGGVENTFTVTNTGTIRSTPLSIRSNGYGISLTGTNGNSQVTNIAGGLIQGIAAGIFAVGTATVFNAGTIVATGTYGGFSVRGYGAYFRGLGAFSLTNAAGGSIAGHKKGIQAYESGTIINAGVIQGGVAGVYGKTGGVTLTNAGTIIATSGAAVRLVSGSRLILDPGEVMSASVQSNVVAANLNDTLELAAGSGASGTLSGLGSRYLGFTSTTLDAGAAWTLTGTNGIGSGSSLINSGSLTLLGATLTDASALVNNGNIVLDPSTMVVASLIGTGTVTIAGGSTLEVQGTLASTETIVFAGGGGVLKLDTPGAASGSVTGAVHGDTIDLAGVNPASVSYGAGTLDFVTNGTSASFPLTGSGTFAAVSDQNGGTDVTLCFCAGTRIATPHGEVPVEALRVGDPVLNVRGEARPLVWVGTGRVLVTRGRRCAATPVIVRKGALADNVPHHDLRVTKGHSLLLDDVLIPVEFLVNHRSILWDDRAQEVTIYHLELATHDVLLANGAPAESYRDDGNRWLFRNANEGWDQPPKPACAQVLTGGPVVDAAWRRLLQRSGPRPGIPTTSDPDLHLVADGQRVDTARIVGGRHLFRLPRRPRELRIVSRASVPAELGLARDFRSLGVALRRILLSRGARLVLLEAETAELADGFHDFEADQAIRWTNGDAVVPTEALSGFGDGFEVELTLGGDTEYPLMEPERVPPRWPDTTVEGLSSRPVTLHQSVAGSLSPGDY